MGDLFFLKCNFLPSTVLAEYVIKFTYLNWAGVTEYSANICQDFLYELDDANGEGILEVILEDVRLVPEHEGLITFHDLKEAKRRSIWVNYNLILTKEKGEELIRDLW